MGLKIMIVTSSAIKKFTIYLIPINRALKHIFTIIDKFLIAFSVWKSVGEEFRVILMGFTLLYILFSWYSITPLKLFQQKNNGNN